VTAPLSARAPAASLPSYPPLVREHYPFLAGSPPVRLLGEVLPRHLRPGTRVVDVGCGIALGACHLVAAGAEGVEYVGLDPRDDVCGPARTVLASLPAAAVHGRIVRTTLGAYLEVGRASADLALCLAAFHECVDPEPPGTIAAELAALLREGGRLVVGDPCVSSGAGPEEVARIRRHAEHPRIPGDGGKPYLDPRALRAALTGAGLELLEWHEGPLFLLGEYLGLPHARYALAVLGAQRRRPGAPPASGEARPS